MIIFLIALIALIIGSFASCVSYRMGRHEPWILTRSKCPQCAINLQIKNLIPFFSWILQKGKCSNCKNKISWRYPVIEIFFVALFFIIYFSNHQLLDINFIFLAAIASTLTIMSVVDIEEYFIPNQLQFILAIFALLFVVFKGGNSDILAHMGSGFVYAGFGLSLYLLFRFMSNTEALGIDDIKLLFVVGFLLGLSKFLAFILMSGIFGIIFGLSWIKFKKDETFPFAPALCLSAFINLLLQKFSLIDIIGSLLFLENF